MQASISFSIRGQQLWLSPMKAVFWEDQRMLILSDLHFGKTGHFRKSGIAVPQQVYQDDLHRLFALVQYFQPASVLVVGDLFHSVENKEAALFARWRMDHDGLPFHLVKGNHDILSADWYQQQDIRVHEQTYDAGPFRFIHEWCESMDKEEDLFCFSGHLHPGIRIKGMGRQSLTLPCFYFEKTHGILPAFGGFTGLYLIEPKKDSTVFVIADNKVMSLT